MLSVEVIATHSGLEGEAKITWDHPLWFLGPKKHTKAAKAERCFVTSCEREPFVSGDEPSVLEVVFYSLHSSIEVL